jgi:hypothetical protein
VTRTNTDLNPDLNNPGDKNKLNERHIRVATFNTRTLKDSWRLSELCWLALHLGIAVLAIQEHRRVTNASAEPGNGWHLIANPASPQGVGGIGFLLSPPAKAALLDLKFVNDRIGHASFALKDRRLHFLCVHAPTAPNTRENPDATSTFYNSLTHLLSSLPARDFVFIGGDFNAPLLPDSRLVKNRCGHPNANSGHLASFIASKDLMAINGYIRQPLHRLPTFFGTRRRLTRLDWILCPLKTRHRIRKVANIRPSCVQSDHSLITCDVELRWQSFKKQPPFPLWADLRNAKTREAFASSVLSSIQNEGVTVEAFTSAITVAADTVLPKRTRNCPKALWESDQQIELARRRLQSSIARLGHDSHETARLRKELADVHAERTSCFIDEAVSEIQAATENSRHRAAWRAINN